jgi:hypothetical protein
LAYETKVKQLAISYDQGKLYWAICSEC